MKVFFFFSFSIFTLCTHAQNTSINPGKDELYREDEVTEVRITISDSDNILLHAEENRWLDIYVSADIVFSNSKLDQVKISNAGLRLRGNTARGHNIFKRDQNKCQYCGKTQDLTLDHLIPRSRGGKSVWTNLVTACLSCNAKKGDKLISETDLILHKKPIKPSFVMFLKNLNHQKQNEWAPFLEPKSNN